MTLSFRNLSHTGLGVVPREFLFVFFCSNIVRMFRPATDACGRGDHAREDPSISAGGAAQQPHPRISTFEVYTKRAGTPPNLAPEKPPQKAKGYLKTKMQFGGQFGRVASPI